MKVLAVGCHPDDLEIACSGTLRGRNHRRKKAHGPVRQPPHQ